MMVNMMMEFLLLHYDIDGNIDGNLWLGFGFEFLGVGIGFGDSYTHRRKSLEIIIRIYMENGKSHKNSAWRK